MGYDSVRFFFPHALINELLLKLNSSKPVCTTNIFSVQTEIFSYEIILMNCCLGEPLKRRSMHGIQDVFVTVSPPELWVSHNQPQVARYASNIEVGL